MSMEAKGADVGAVRDEDRFDAAAVDAWLRAHAPGFDATPGEPDRKSVV